MDKTVEKLLDISNQRLIIHEARRNRNKVARGLDFGLPERSNIEAVQSGIRKDVPEPEIHQDRFQIDTEEDQKSVEMQNVF